MKKLTLFGLIVALALSAFVGCGPEITIEPAKDEVVETETPDLSSVESTYTWPPRISEGEAAESMALVDEIMGENWENLKRYEAAHGDPSAEVKLYYSYSQKGSISDVVVIELMILADNGYTDYVERRALDLEAYNEAFATAGGDLPEWAPGEVEDVRSYLN